MNRIIKNGQIKAWIYTVGQIIGVGSGYLAYRFSDDISNYKFWVFACIAFVFGYGFSWVGLMQKWGFKIFTNDPLGWRSAKKTYLDSEKESKK